MRFSEPPSVRAPAHDWEEVLATLSQRPGEWLLVDENERFSVVNALRAGKISALRDRVYITTRNNHTDDNGVRRCALYLMLKED